VPIEPASASPSPSVSPGACGACGEPITGEDARCTSCGHRAAGVDHAEEVLGAPGAGTGGLVVLGAGITDRGHKRRRNEDAYALERVTTAGGAAAVVAVVCDGVASVPGGATASRTACDVAVAAGQEALVAGQDLDDTAATMADAARRAVAALAPGAGAAPACTYVAAVLDGERAVVTWVGDSRAYWLSPAAPEDSAALTEDDSWAAEMVAAGIVGEDDALTDPRAHVITRWLAADAPDVLARHRSWVLDGSGTLLLCSDGVWNHLPDPAVLAAALDTAATPADADAVHAGAKALVDAALDDGGHDNATAILLAVAPASDGGG
jgi:serine/threonine protein phosphatase PrpC